MVFNLQGFVNTDTNDNRNLKKGNHLLYTRIANGENTPGISKRSDSHGKYTIEAGNKAGIAKGNVMRFYTVKKNYRDLREGQRVRAAFFPPTKKNPLWDVTVEVGGDINLYGYNMTLEDIFAVFEEKDL